MPFFGYSIGMDAKIDYKELGNRARAARKRKGYTQEQLAEIIGITPGHVGNIEHAHTKIGLDTLIRLCRALDVTPDKLLFDSAFQPKTVTNHEMAELLQQATPAQLKKVVKLVRTMLE